MHTLSSNITQYHAISYNTGQYDEVIPGSYEKNIFFSILYFRFLKETMNIIDMVAICPFYISLILEGLEDFEIIGKTGKMIRLVGGQTRN